MSEQVTAAEVTTENTEQAAQQPEKMIQVDAPTFLSMQMMQIDNDIALAELKVAELKQKKSQMLLDFNVKMLNEKAAQQEQAATAPAQEQK